MLDTCLKTCPRNPNLPYCLCIYAAKHHSSLHSCPLHPFQNIFGVQFRQNTRADRLFQWQTKQYLVGGEFTDKKGTCSATNLPRHCQSYQQNMGMFRFTSDHVNLKESLKNRKGYLVTYRISFLVIPSFTLCILTFSSYPRRKLM